MDNIFVAILSEKPDSSTHRKAHYAKMLYDPPAGIEVLDVAILPLNPSAAAIIFAKSADQLSLASWLAVAKGTFEINIHDVTDFDHDDSAGDVSDCLIAYAQHDFEMDIDVTDLPAAKIRTTATLKPGGTFSHIRLIRSDHAIGGQVEMGRALGRAVVATPCMSLQTYFDGTYWSQPQVPTTPVVEPDASAPRFMLRNMGKDPIFGSATGVAEDNYGLIQTGKNAINPSDTPTSVATPLFVWGRLQSIFEYKVGSVSGKHIKKTVLTNMCPPVVRMNVAPESSYALNLDNHLKGDISVQIVTEMSSLLDDILNTNKHDAAWEEDSFTGDNLAAYKYILSRIPGNVPPKSGTVKPGIINAISYPASGGISRDAFDYVKEYLAKEATYFEYAQDWFGPDGLLTAINMQVLITGIDALISTTELMEIKHESLLDMILDTIFNIIIGIVGAIPTVGPVIAGVLKIGMATAKAIIIATGGSLTINATVAEMARELTDTLQSLTVATAKQFADVTGNYGKLETFASNVINGTISDKKLGVGIAAAHGKGNSSSPKLPNGYVKAVGEGWEVAFFQRMFEIRFTPSGYMQFARQDMASPWDPAKANYGFVYNLPVTYEDKFGKAVKARLVARFYPSATPEVHSRLFDPDQLAVDPISFFCGLGGWNYIFPLYQSGNMDDQTDPKIISIP